jgi:hypothetical protein
MQDRQIKLNKIVKIAETISRGSIKNLKIAYQNLF